MPPLGLKNQNFGGNNPIKWDKCYRIILTKEFSQTAIAERSIFTKFDIHINTLYIN